MALTQKILLSLLKEFQLKWKESKKLKSQKKQSLLRTESSPGGSPWCRWSAPCQLPSLSAGQAGSRSEWCPSWEQTPCHVPVEDKEKSWSQILPTVFLIQTRLTRITRHYSFSSLCSCQAGTPESNFQVRHEEGTKMYWKYLLKQSEGCTENIFWSSQENMKCLPLSCVLRKTVVETLISHHLIVPSAHRTVCSPSIIFLEM